MTARRPCMALLLAACVAPAALAKDRLARLAWLSTGSDDQAGGTLALVKRTLAGRGHVEGRTIVYDEKWTGDNLDHVDALARALVQGGPDVMIGTTTPVVAALRRASRSIPIVMMSVSDPVGAGLAASLARPGGNVTGATDLGLDLAPKQFEILRLLMPHAMRVGVLMSDNAAHPAQYAAMVGAAAQAGVTLQAQVVLTGQGIDAAFASLAGKGVNVVIILGGPPFTAIRPRIAELAIRAKMVTLGPSRLYVDAGGLLSLAPTHGAAASIAADYVDRILRGANPAELPIQQPTTVELAVNLRTARALGLALPPELRLRADVVIE